MRLGNLELRQEITALAYDHLMGYRDSDFSRERYPPS